MYCYHVGYLPDYIEKYDDICITYMRHKVDGSDKYTRVESTMKKRQKYLSIRKKLDGIHVRTVRRAKRINETNKMIPSIPDPRIRKKKFVEVLKEAGDMYKLLTDTRRAYNSLVELEIDNTYNKKIVRPYLGVLDLDTGKIEVTQDPLWQSMVDRDRRMELWKKERELLDIIDDFCVGEDS